MASTIQFSDDNGKNWKNSTSGQFSVHGNGIGYNPEDNVWIAVGDNSTGTTANNTNTIKLSKDNGKTWQDCTTGGFNDAAGGDDRNGGYGIAYNPEDKVWIAVGDNRDEGTTNNTVGTIQISNDNGKNWKKCNSGGFGGNECKGIAYNPEDKVWVAVGISANNAILPNQTIKFSRDNGKNWQNCTTGGFTGGSFGIAYNTEDKVWVAVGDDNDNAAGSIQISTDNGKNWKDCSSGGFADNGRGISYNPEDKVWVAVGDDNFNAAGSIQISTDNGKNWQNCTTGGFTGGGVGLGIAYNPEDKVWVAVGEGVDASESIQFSTDNGKNWKKFTTGNMRGGFGIAYNPVDKRWIVVGDPV